MHYRGAEAAYKPCARSIIWIDGQIDDVLDHRETGPDGKSGYDCIKLVADAVEAEEQDDARRLERFLDPWRNEPAVVGKTDWQRVDQSTADGVDGNSGNASKGQQ